MIRTGAGVETEVPLSTPFDVGLLGGRNDYPGEFIAFRMRE
jgi:hypothetical protein